MAVFEIKAPDGKTYRIEGADQQGALRALQQHLGTAPAPAPSPATPTSQPAPAAATPTAGAAVGAGVTPDQMAQYTPEQQAFINDVYAQPEFVPEAPRPLSQTIRENVMGDDDPTTFNTGEKIGQMINNAGESLTFGLVGDEASAAVGSAMGGDYDTILQNKRDTQAQFRQQHPGLSIASEVAPAFLPGAGVAKLVQGANRLGRAGYGALVGATGGATYGFMEGEGGVENRATNAAITGGLGGFFGAVAPRAIEGLANLPSNVRRTFQRSAQRPTIAALEETKTAAYKAADEAGVSFSGDDMTSLSNRVQQIFADSNFDEIADTASGAVLRQLRGKEGRETTLGQLDRVRQGLWKRYATAQDQPQILDAIGEIDNLIARSSDASELMGAARAANATYAKSLLLETAFDRAQRATSVSGSGGNIANNYRRAINSILNNKREMRFFSGEEEKAMRRFVAMADSGGPALRRLIGKMSPSGNGLMMTLHAVGGIASSGATLPLMVLGGVAKNSADNSVLRGADALQDAFAGTRPLNPRPNALSATSGGIVSGAVPLIEQGQSDARNVLR